jgi:hypothetical protein
VVNVYGPTEATTFAVCGAVEALPHDAVSVPIGRPIANTSGYVLDRKLRPVPVGLPGELFIGGPGVARGYAGRPALTAERFLPDPFAGDGSRMYSTGDIVRYRRDGTMEFLGRADDRTEIKGFRVEPSEVEAALARHPKVRQAAVIVDEAVYDRRLIAYVVPADAAHPPTDLREFLQATLPPYMVPAAFVVLQALPMTENRKVDKAALPAAPDEASRAVSGQLAPQTALEGELATLTARMLGLSAVGVTDDFFTLGGRSLLAMRLVNRINERYAANVALRDFFQEPTVARLAAEVAATRDTARPEGAEQSPSETDQRLLDQIDELSDHEVDKLLGELSEDEAER